MLDRSTADEFTLNAGHGAGGIAVSRTHLWAASETYRAAGGKLYAYNLATGARDSTRDVTVLGHVAAPNGYSGGLHYWNKYRKLVHYIQGDGVRVYDIPGETATLWNYPHPRHWNTDTWIGVNERRYGFGMTDAGVYDTIAIGRELSMPTEEGGAATGATFNTVILTNRTNPCWTDGLSELYRSGNVATTGYTYYPGRSIGRAASGNSTQLGYYHSSNGIPIIVPTAALWGAVAKLSSLTGSVYLLGAADRKVYVWKGLGASVWWNPTGGPEQAAGRIPEIANLRMELSSANSGGVTPGARNNITAMTRTQSQGGHQVIAVTPVGGGATEYLTHAAQVSGGIISGFIVQGDSLADRRFYSDALQA